MGYSAVNQLRANISALLQVRGEDQAALARWLGRDKSTVNKFLKGKRELQLADLDRVADFFGVATYQLFQPGINTLTERRSGVERRSGQDRRVGHAQRELQSLSAAIDANRPRRAAGAPVPAHVLKLRALTERYERELAALFSQTASTRRQTSAARDAVAAPRVRRRAPGGSNPEETEG